VAGRWFSTGTPVSSTNKTDHTPNPIVQFEVCKLGQVFEHLVILVDMLDKDCTSFKTLSILDKSRLPQTLSHNVVSSTTRLSGV
jgi:hypothetical protein